MKQSSQKEISRLASQLEETQQELEKKIVELQKAHRTMIIIDLN